MTPSAAERDALFKTFGRAWFKRDATLLYEAVTPDFVWHANDGDGRTRRITGREAVGSALAASGGSGGVERRFADVAYHHATDASFMTFRLIETDKATGAVREEVGLERYTFKDGRIAVKDVYRKPAG
ncbi:MAG: nuclear transport factor 2 family protein [Hyphomicrobiaceae bacterium]|nr:nuclear transport factor 2 family protein [Hyphomicrobiaceae bacterium]